MVATNMRLNVAIAYYLTTMATVENSGPTSGPELQLRIGIASAASPLMVFSRYFYAIELSDIQIDDLKANPILLRSFLRFLLTIFEGDSSSTILAVINSVEGFLEFLDEPGLSDAWTNAVMLDNPIAPEDRMTVIPLSKWRVSE